MKGFLLAGCVVMGSAVFVVVFVVGVEVLYRVSVKVLALGGME